MLLISNGTHFKLLETSFQVDILFSHTFIRVQVADSLSEQFGCVERSVAILAHVECLVLYGKNVVMAKFYDKILAQISQNILSLHVDAPFAKPPNGLGSLREFCMCEVTSIKLDGIMSCASALERIHLEFKSDQILDGQKLEAQLIQLWSGDSMQSVSIKIDKHISAVQRALVKSKFRKQTEWRGKIHITEQIENAHEYVEVFTERLMESSDDYILKFRCVMVETLIGTVSNSFAFKVGDVLRMTRTNANCQINGYRDNWIYRCVCNR